MNTRLITSVFFTCLLWLEGMCSYAETPIATINNLDQQFDLNPYVETIEDVNHEFTIEDVQAGKYDQLWQRNKERYFLGRNFKSRYWFRIKLNWLGQENYPAVLYIHNHPAGLSRINIILPTPVVGKTRIVTTGHSEMFLSRDIKSQGYGFVIPLSPEQSQTILGYVSNSEVSIPVLLPLYLLSEAEFNATQDKVSYLLCAIYAAMGVLVIYNLCLFVILRKSYFGFYILFLISAILVWTNIDGSSIRWIFPESPTLNQRLATNSSFLISIAYLLFVMEALEEITFPVIITKLYRCQVFFGLISLLVANTLEMNMPFISFITQVYASISVSFCIILIILAILKRHPIALYLMIAEVITLLGATAYLLMTHGILPIHPLTLWGTHWAWLGEGLLLSLALAARMRLSQQDAIDRLLRYENLYESSVQGLFHFDFLDNSLKCNTAFAQLFGYSDVNEIPPRKTPLEQFEKSVQAELPQILAKTGYVTHYETQILSPKLANPIWVSLNMRLVKDEKGKAIGTEGSMVDISERKLKEQMEQELSKANKLALENLSRSDELKNEFLATMSHELRTPMNGISGYLELLKSPEDNSDSLALVNSLEHCSADMLRLIDRILDFTQLLAGNLSINTELLDFSLLLAELETAYCQRCKSKALTFNVTKDDNVPKKIWGDRKKLFVIINDLLDNAVKYTQAGGIEVVIRAIPIRSISGNSYEIMNTVLVSVRDTGIGIALADRPKIFKAFSQLDGAFNRKQGGLGLGLAMCHEYIKLMNGTLTLLSNVGNGSRFDFMVDLKVVPNLATSTTAVVKTAEPLTVTKSANATILGANILIVEDNPTNQLVLNGILKKLGHQTSIAENGIQALEILANAEFDLILMDCQMPEMDGFEATRTIRSGSRLKDIPIIAVTANVMEGDEQRCLDAGMNDYMKKPIKKELLMEKISQWYKS